MSARIKGRFVGAKERACWVGLAVLASTGVANAMMPQVGCDGMDDDEPGITGLGGDNCDDWATALNGLDGVSGVDCGGNYPYLYGDDCDAWATALNKLAGGSHIHCDEAWSSLMVRDGDCPGGSPAPNGTLAALTAILQGPTCKHGDSIPGPKGGGNCTGVCDLGWQGVNCDTPAALPTAHCPPAEAACAADQNCHAIGLDGDNYQLHGCSDALVPNNDWTVYVLSNTSEWQVLARDSNVDESQCKVHPTGVISGTCSPPAPPTAHCPPAEAACAADQNCHAIGLTPIGVDDHTYQLHGCSDSLLPNNDWTVYVLSSNTSEWQVLARHTNVDESGCKVHPTGVISGTCSDPTPPAPPPTPPAPPQCYAAGQCLPAGSDKKDGKTLCCNKKHAKKDENCAHGKRHGKKGFACALSTAPRGRAFEILQQ